MQQTQGVSRASHYAVLASLLISNLTVLGLGMLLAGPVAGQSLGYFAYLGDIHKIHKAEAATRGTLTVQAQDQGCATTNSGSATIVGGSKLQKVCPTVPPAPSNIYAVGNSPTVVTVTWDDTPNEIGYSVERATGTEPAPLHWGQIGTQSQDMRVYTDFNGVPNTSYSYRVQAFNAVGSSPYSTVASATTWPAAPVISSTAPVSNSTISNITTTSGVNYTLSETVASGSITMTRTGGAADGASPHTCTLKGAALNGGAHIALNMSDTTNGCTIAQSLINGAVYTFAFNARDTYGTSASMVTNTNITYTEQVPAAPSGLIASATSTTAIVLYWTDNSNNELGFNIERASGTPTTTMAWDVLWYHPSANATSYTDTNLIPGTAYSYRMQSYNAAGTSGYSNTASATTW